MNVYGHEIWEANLEGIDPPNVDFALMSDLHHGLSTNTHANLEKFFKSLSEKFKRWRCTPVIIVAGDIISCDQNNLFKLFRLLRVYLPKEQFKVVFCYGNHDFWQIKPYRNKYPDYSEILKTRKKLADEFELHDVDSGILEVEIDRRRLQKVDGKLVRSGPGDHYKVAVVGFDGWYWHLSPPTNDKTHMRKIWDVGEPFVFLNNKAHKDLERLLTQDYSQYEKVVCVTHFPPFTDNIKYHTFNASPGYMPFLTENFDVLCVGHSHRKNNFVENGCLVLNCGSQSGLLKPGEDFSPLIEFPRAALFKV